MRLPPWLWNFCASKRTQRVLIVAPFALMVLGTAAYVGVDHWGRRKFEKQVAALKAEGIPLTLREAYGPPLAPEDDVFQHPAWVREGSETVKLGVLWSLKLPAIGQPKSVSSIDPNRCPFDVRLWSTDSAKHKAPADQVAQELLQELRPFSDRWETWATAFERPHLSFSTHEGSVIDDLGILYKCMAFACQWSVLELEARKPERAREVLHHYNWIVQRLLDDDRGTVFQRAWSQDLFEYAVDAVWHGVAQQQWQVKRTLITEPVS